MDSSDEAPASSMPPPTLAHSQETRRYSKGEWEVQKPFIVGMYHLTGMTLEKIADFLKERGFYVTQRQLKRKIATWRLDKNVKNHEMEAIVRKQARLKAKGKTSAFRVRGQPVDQTKIDRWQKRTGYSQPAFISQRVVCSPTPTTPTLSVISYNAISERGTQSPYPLSRNLDMSQGYAQLTNTDFPNLLPQNQKMVFQNFEGHEGPQPPFGLRPTSIVEPIETQSDFSGQSPAPFTAPSSPALSWRAASSIVGFPVSSNPITQNSYEPTEGLVTPYLHPNETVESRFILTSPRTRYRQQEENEYQQRLDALVRQHGPNHPVSLDTLHRLGVILRDQGRYKAAETTFREAIEGWQKTYGDGHPKTIRAQIWLSTIFLDQGRFKASMTLLRKAYTTASKVLHPTHDALITIKANLAMVLCYIAQYPESETLCREALRVGASTLPPDDRRILDCLRTLAALMNTQGKYDESERMLREVALACFISYGPNDPFVLYCSYQLCCSLFSQGKYSECEIKISQVLAAQTKLLGPEHSHTLWSQSILAKTVLAGGRNVEGEKLVRDAVEKLSRVQGPKNYLTLSIELELVQVYLGQKRYAKAESLAAKMLALSETYSRTRTFLVKCMMSIARIHLAQGRIEEGLAMLKSAVDESMIHFGANHCTTKASTRDYLTLVQDIEQMDREELIRAWTPNTGDGEGSSHLVPLVLE